MAEPNCPVCHTPVVLPAADCVHCGTAQPARLAGIVWQLDQALTAANAARAETQAYLQSLRAGRPQPAQALTLVPGPPIPPPHLRPAAPAPKLVPVPAPPPQSLPRFPAPRPEPQPTPAQPHREPQVKRVRHRLSLQATLLGLGVLLLLAAGVTFLAVNWDTLPVALQAGIMAALGFAALGAAISAGRRKLSGTAEAFAVLGAGLLAVDVYGARELGLIPRTTDGLTYAGLGCAVLTGLFLVLRRIAPTVMTFALAAVVIGQLPLPLLLVDRAELSIILLGLVAQAVATLLWTVSAPPVVRLTGAVLALVGYSTVIVLGLARAVGLADGASFAAQFAATVVVALAATIGLQVVRHRLLPFGVPPALGECFNTAVGSLAVVAVFAQAPVVGRWLPVVLTTGLVVAEFLPRRRLAGTTSAMLRTALAVVAGTALVLAMARLDGGQLAILTLLVGAAAALAFSRRRLELAPAAAVVFASFQVSVALLAIDRLISPWAAALAFGVISAVVTAFLCGQVGRAAEQVMLPIGAAAAVLGTALMAAISSRPGAALVLAIAAAPLIAYGRLPGRRPALLVAVPLLTAANALFVAGSAEATLELYTVPPALLMIAVGVLAWRDEPSWISLGPALLVGLLPSTIVADGTDSVIRLAVVLAAAVAVILMGLRFSLQAPFVVGATVVAKLGLWQFIEVAPLIPRWITLALAGTILLAVGISYERRLTEAKQAAHWISTLH
jgi:hypothetical protein